MHPNWTDLITREYDLSIVDIQLLQAIEDEVYLLRTADGNPYKFRIHASLNAQEQEALVQIYDWTAYLNHQLDIPVPELLPSKTQQKFLLLAKDRKQKTSLSIWIDWRVLPAWNKEVVFRIGQQIRRVHDASKQYKGIINSIKKIDGHWVKTIAAPSLLSALSVEQHSLFTNRINFGSLKIFVE